MVAIINGGVYCGLIDGDGLARLPYTIAAMPLRHNFFLTTKLHH